MPQLGYANGQIRVRTILGDDRIAFTLGKKCGTVASIASRWALNRFRANEQYRRSREILIARVQQAQRGPNLRARRLMKQPADQYDFSDPEFH